VPHRSSRRTRSIPVDAAVRQGPVSRVPRRFAGGDHVGSSDATGTRSGACGGRGQPASRAAACPRNRRAFCFTNTRPPGPGLSERTPSAPAALGAPVLAVEEVALAAVHAQVGAIPRHREAREEARDAGRLHDAADPDHRGAAHFAAAERPSASRGGPSSSSRRVAASTSEITLDMAWQAPRASKANVAGGPWGAAVSAVKRLNGPVTSGSSGTPVASTASRLRSPADHGRRQPDRAAGVGAQRAVDGVGGHGGARAAAGSAGDAGRVPGVAAVAEVQIPAGGACDPLVQAEWAEVDRARLGQPCERGRLGRADRQTLIGRFAD